MDATRRFPTRYSVRLSQLEELFEEPSFEQRIADAVLGADSAETEHPVPVLLKMLVLGRCLSLGDSELVEEVRDRISLRRCCGLSLAETVPETEALELFRRRIPAELLDEIERSWNHVPTTRSGEEAPVLSVVSPVYQADEIVDELVKRITQEASKVTPRFEIVLVDDGSPDSSWQRIEAACARDPRVRGLRLSRNFGQHYALTAGLDHARGRFVLVMDCDLQDDPKYIPQLYEKALEGYDIVYAIHEKRAHGVWKNLSGALFAWILNRLSGGQVADPRMGSFSLLSARAVAAFRQVGDVHRHYLLVLRWLGFDSAEVFVEHKPRYRGRSSYSFVALVRHAVNGITSQSDRLLYLALGVGFTFLCISCLAALYLVTMYFLHGFKEGWTSTIVLILLSTSAILLSIGALGIYVGKIFEQVKKRPLYLVERRLNF